MRNVFPVLTVFLLVTVLSLQLALAQDMNEYTVEEQDNLATTGALIDAFVAGDLEGFLGYLAEDVTWEINGSADFVPSHGVWQGREAVRDWLAQVNEELEFLEFTPERFWADGDTVIVICHEVDIARATGKPIDQREAAFFTFAEGKVVSFLLFDDSGQEHWAMTPDA